MRLGFNWSVALLLPIALIASDAYGDGYSNIEEVRNDLKGILDPLVDDGIISILPMTKWLLKVFSPDNMLMVDLNIFLKIFWKKIFSAINLARLFCWQHC